MILDTILPIPDLAYARRVLCIQPHYDDNDIGAGGTLAQLAQAGAEILYLTVTDDLMGIIDTTLTDEAARRTLIQDQEQAAARIGVRQQYWLNYPDAADYSTTALRRDLLKMLRQLRPDWVFAPDPWLAYEAHHDHIQTGLAAAEAVIQVNLTKISSSDPAVDEAYTPHEIRGMAFYYTREPNHIQPIDNTWEAKLAAVRCYVSQFTPPAMAQLIGALDAKSRQAATGRDFTHGEPLKVLHPQSLHCGI